MTTSITAEKAKFSDDEEAVALKIQADICELNIWLKTSEIDKLRLVSDASWESGSLQIGKCANSNAYWSCDDGILSILVGNDDETWDFGIFIPQLELITILKEIELNLQNGD